ncbi:MAG: RluA family pseudouridine synthase [Candidatus Gracilibacteria bacterium]|nr:RluA family pseudouridine synthase [Candidatus Gracilibacteria bacterium]
MQTFSVPKKHDGARIDVVLADIMDAYSRAFAQKLIRKSLVKIGDGIAKKGHRVKEGDIISVEEQDLSPSKFGAKDIPLEILYEDDDLLVVNKPPGMLTHPSAHERDDTLVNALLFHCGDRLSGIGGELRPGIVHRLDKDTSGILVVAKHDESHRDLAQQIQNREVEKFYLTLVNGLMENNHATIDAPLLKTQVRGKNKVIVSPGEDAKNSTTHFWVNETYEGRFSLLKVQIITGRMHQIRVHLSSINHSVIGDTLYGNHKANTEFKQRGLSRQFLHAYQLKFKHPRTHKMVEFTAPLPDDLQNILDGMNTEVSTKVFSG